MAQKRRRAQQPSNPPARKRAKHSGEPPTDATCFPASPPSSENSQLLEGSFAACVSASPTIATCFPASPPSSENSQLLEGSVPASLAHIVSGAFYTLGRLGVARSGTWSQQLDYHALVSLVDFSVWIQYCAWDRSFFENDSGPEDEWGEKITDSPFKPDNGPDWARLPGFQSRVLMARIAQDVRTWKFSNEEVTITDTDIWSDESVVPAISAAIVDSLGAVVPSLTYSP